MLYDKERRVEDRRWLETAVVPPVKDADYQCVFNVIVDYTVNREIDKCLGSGDSTLARVKIKEIDGATPQGVDCAA